MPGEYLTGQRLVWLILAFEIWFFSQIFLLKNLLFIQGQIIYSETSEDKVACLSFCKSTDECAWFSFDTTGILSTCILFMDCPEIEENPQFVSGQKECDIGDGEYLNFLYISEV